MPHPIFRLLPLAALFLAFTACRPDPVIPPTIPPPPPPPDTTAATGVLRLTVLPEWEGQSLQTFTEYQNFMNYRTTVELLKMYFGDVRAIAGGDTAMVKDVDLFDLGTGTVVKHWTIEEGVWAKLRAGLGVPAGLNYEDPAEYGPGHPLSVSNGTHWSWSSGYRYVMFEGRYDPDPSSTAQLITAYSIHPGMEPSYIEFELLPAQGITITAGDTTDVTVRVAVDRFFHSVDHQIDLATENTAHGMNVPLQLKLVENIAASFSTE